MNTALSTRDSTESLDCSVLPSEMNVGNDALPVDGCRVSAEDFVEGNISGIGQQLRRAGVLGSIAALVAALPNVSEAGIIFSVDNSQNALNRGSAATVSGGGNLVWVAVTDGSGMNAQTHYGSGVAFNYDLYPNHTIVATAQHGDIYGASSRFSLGTGDNIFSNPGNVINVDSNAVFRNSLYTGPGSLGQANDLMLFAIPKISNLNNLVFATQRLGFGDQIEQGGFGRTGLWDQEGSQVFDGSARVGNALVNSSPYFGGASPSLYMGTFNTLSDPQSLRLDSGDSGGFMFSRVGGDLVWHGMGTQASLNIGGTRSQGVAIAGNEQFYGQLNNLGLASVPEPSSAVLFGVAAVGWWLRGRFRRPSGDSSAVVGENPATEDSVEK